MEQYRYYAFISYSHKDEKVARWLHRNLEGYLLPVDVKNEFDEGQKYLRPIFRDKEELSAGVLKEELMGRLRESKYLIVVCSPNSASSHWVSDGVKAFVEMGRLDRIIPLMIGDGHDSLPEYLTEYTAAHPEQELLWVNVNEIGYEKSLIRIISRMLGVSFDTLWERDTRLRRIKRIKKTVITAVLILLSLIALVSGLSLFRYKIESKAESVMSEVREALDLGNITKAEYLIGNEIPKRYANDTTFTSLAAEIERIKSHGYYPAFSFESGIADINEDGDLFALANEGQTEIFSVPSFNKVLSMSFPGETPHFISFIGQGKDVLFVSHMYEEVQDPPYVRLISHERIRILDSSTGEVRCFFETGLSNPYNGVHAALDPSGRYLAMVDGQKIRYYMAPGDDIDAMEKYLSDISEDRLVVYDLQKNDIVYSADLNCEVDIIPSFEISRNQIKLHLAYRSYASSDLRLGMLDDVIGDGSLSVSDIDRDESAALPGPDRNKWCWHTGILENASSGETREFIPGRRIKSLKADRDASVLLTDSNVWVRNFDADPIFAGLDIIFGTTFSRTGHTAAFNSDGVCHIVDLSSPAVIDTIAVTGNIRLCGEDILIEASNDKIRIIDFLKRRVLYEFVPQGFESDDGELFHFTVSSDLSLCAVQAESGKMCIYRTLDEELLYVEPSFARSSRSLYDRKHASDFIPGTHKLVVAGDPNQIFDADKGRYVDRLIDDSRHTHPYTVMVSADGMTLLIADGSTCDVYDLQSHMLLRSIQHEYVSNSDGPIVICYDESTSRVIMSSLYGGAVILDTAEGRELGAISYEDGGMEVSTGFFVDGKPYVYVLEGVYTPDPRSARVLPFSEAKKLLNPNQ